MQRVGQAQSSETPPLSQHQSPAPANSSDGGPHLLLADILAVIAIVLSIVAIYYAVRQNEDARAILSLANQISASTTRAVDLGKSTLDGIDRASDILSDSVNDLQSVATQLPTRYVGGFPNNIDAVTNLFKSATSNVTIVTDFAGYSSYSDPGRFRDYFNALESATRRNPALAVRLYVYSPAERERWLQMAYPRGSFPDHAFRSPTDDLLSAFLRRMSRRNVRVTTYDEFIAAMMADEDQWIKQFQDLERCECFELRGTVPIFLWMIDGRDCVFTFAFGLSEKRDYFSFCTRDGRLIEYFHHYVTTTMATAHLHPSKSTADVSAMNLLVPQLGTCTKIDGRLAPCAYHRDRLDVRYFEQADSDGERDMDEVTVELRHTPSIDALFDQMAAGSQPAGCWGLMMGHRQWLLERIGARVDEPDRSHLAILQLGTAGPVHYFATAKLLTDAIVRCRPKAPLPVRLHTIDKCLGPVVIVKSLLNTIAASNDAERGRDDWNVVQADGLQVSLDPSFKNIFANGFPDQTALTQTVSLADVCGERFLDDGQDFDITLAHLTFSTWAGESDERCRRGYQNIARTLRTGGSCLVALSEFHNPAIKAVDHYHAEFAKVGLRLIDATRAWDVYDLSEAERQQFRLSTNPQAFRKRVVLAEYRKS